MATAGEGASPPGPGAGDAAGSAEEVPKAALARRTEAVEEAYEFFLAYAAQGTAGEGTEGGGGQIRVFLGRALEAVTGMAAAAREAVEATGLEPRATWGAFLDVLARDADAAGAALALVSSRPRVSSQLVDNLNANTHLRALLTDLFLLDEALK